VSDCQEREQGDFANCEASPICCRPTAIAPAAARRRTLDFRCIESTIDESCGRHQRDWFAKRLVARGVGDRQTIGKT
jgi:hypothetical protein